MRRERRKMAPTRIGAGRGGALAACESLRVDQPAAHMCLVVAYPHGARRAAGGCGLLRRGGGLCVRCHRCGPCPPILLSTLAQRHQTITYLKSLLSIGRRAERERADPSAARYLLRARLLFFGVFSHKTAE